MASHNDAGLFILSGLLEGGTEKRDMMKAVFLLRGISKQM